MAAIQVLHVYLCRLNRFLDGNLRHRGRSRTAVHPRPQFWEVLAHHPFWGKPLPLNFVFFFKSMNLTINLDVRPQVGYVNFTWKSGEKKYYYHFDRLQSFNEEVLQPPLISVEIRGRIPRKPRGKSLTAEQDRVVGFLLSWRSWCCRLALLLLLLPVLQCSACYCHVRVTPAGSHLSALVYWSSPGKVSHFRALHCDCDSAKNAPKEVSSLERRWRPCLCRLSSIRFLLALQCQPIHLKWDFRQNKVNSFEKRVEGSVISVTIRDEDDGTMMTEMTPSHS